MCISFIQRRFGTKTWRRLPGLDRPVIIPITSLRTKAKLEALTLLQLGNLTTAKVGHCEKTCASNELMSSQSEDLLAIIWYANLNSHFILFPNVSFTFLLLLPIPLVG